MSDQQKDGQADLSDRPSKSQRKREVKLIAELAQKLLLIPDEQLAPLPYPVIVQAIIDCKTITKGNARKRQIQFIAKQLRHVDLNVVHQVVDRFDASSRTHITHFHQLEVWRDRLMAQDKQVLGEILQQCPLVDRQHLRQLVRNAVDERSKQAIPPVHFRKLFQYLKAESENPRSDSQY